MNSAITDLTPFERDLARALDGYLGPRRPVDAGRISRAAITTRPPRRIALPGLSVRATQRLAWLVLVALTIAALLATAFVVGQQRPKPMDTPLPSQLVVAPPSAQPSAAPTAAPIAFKPYYPIFARSGEPGSVDILAMLPDGSERSIAHFAPREPATVESDIQGLTRIVFTGAGSVSNDGWLALRVGWGSGDENQGGYALVPIANLDATPWVVPARPEASGAWTEMTGDISTQFAALSADGQSLDVYRPTTHTTFHVPASPIGGTILWSVNADGPMVSKADDSLGTVYGTYSIGDRVVRAGISLAYDASGQRPLGNDGWAICDARGLIFVIEPGCGTGTLATARGDGSMHAWDVPLETGQIVQDETFAADGAGMWAIASGGPVTHDATLVKLDSPDDSRIVTTLDRRSLANVDTSGGDHLLFAGVAPDDSLIVIEQLSGLNSRTTVLPTDGTEAHVVDPDTNLLGFVTPDVLGITYSPPQIGSPLPFVTPIPPPPSATPSPSRTPAHSNPPLPSVIPVDGPYLPVITRTDGSTLTVIVADATGNERIVRRIAMDGLLPSNGSEAFVTAVSNDGWLYVDAQNAFGLTDAFYDLSHPDAPVWQRTAQPQATSPRFGPNGLLGTDNGNTFIDPRTHTIYQPAGDVYFGGGPFLAWTADGTAVYTNGVRNIAPIGGGTFYSGLLPTWDPIGGRYVGADGKVLCDFSALFLGLANVSECSSDRVGVVSAATGFEDYGADLPDNLAVEASSFAADGTSVWTLGLDVSRTRPLELIRLGETDSVVASLARSQVPFTVGLADTHVGFGGFAPDDSVIVITNYDYSGNPARLYVSSDGSSVTSHEGNFAGFVPASLAAEWPTVP